VIVRLIAVDPRPRKGESDLVVYQVPEHSRAYELLTELMGEAKIEWALIETPPRKALDQQLNGGNSK
jgi:hypothetical protein